MMSRERQFGTGKGKVYPHQAARSLLNPLRRLIISPSAMVEFLRLSGHERLLEIGCGPGYFSTTLAGALSSGELILFDLQLEMLQMAVARLPAPSMALAVNGDALALPFADEAFDVVLMVTVLGEIPDAAASLRQIRRVLRSTGRVVIVEQRGDADYLSPADVATLAGSASFAVSRRQRGRFGLSHINELSGT
jgi:SAM-dependent methyltransferase